MIMIRGETPVRFRVSTLAAAFLLAVGLILGAVPGWELCFAAWAVLAVLTLVATALALLGFAAWQLCRKRGGLAMRELAQAGCIVLAMAAFWPMHFLSGYVILAGMASELKDEAAAMPSDGEPRFAWRAADERGGGQGGFAYDPSGQIVRPPGLRSASWEHRVAGTVFASAGECWSAEHVVGPWYRWETHGCGD